MKKNIRLLHVFLIALLTQLFFSCATLSGAKDSSGGQKGNAFGYCDVVFSNAPVKELNKRFTDKLEISLKNTVTKKTVSVKTDNNGFFIFKNLDFYVPYEFENIVFSKEIKHTNYNYKIAISGISFVLVADKEISVLDSSFEWDLGNSSLERQDNFGKSLALYEKVKGKPYSGNKYTVPNSYKTADSYKNNTPDKRIEKLIKDKKLNKIRKSKPEKYVALVAAKIQSYAKNDFEKAKLAYDFVTILLTYDAKNFLANTIPDQSVEKILKTNIAVCDGYARLYQRICLAMKLPCQRIEGFGRGVNDKDDPSKANHAWNLVKVKGAWYLVDTTWGSGYLDGSKAVKSYNTDWLFVRPEQFIYTHLPTNPAHQLLDEPYTVSAFRKLPNVSMQLFNSLGDLSGVDLNRFVKNFTIYSASKTFKIKSPVEAPLQRGEKYTFEVEVKDGKNVLVVCGDDITWLDSKGNGLFKKTVKIPKGCKEVIVGIADSQKGKYEYIAQYTTKK
ncbi:MAG: hypothetical protein MJ188_09730 [Treponema sp.]|nr:hypothetical protein [Treponema sp.]